VTWNGNGRLSAAAEAEVVATATAATEVAAATPATSANLTCLFIDAPQGVSG
jgi:hypothetical protein